MHTRTQLSVIHSDLIKNDEYAAIDDDHHYVFLFRDIKADQNLVLGFGLSLGHECLLSLNVSHSVVTSDTVTSTRRSLLHNGSLSLIVVSSQQHQLVFLVFPIIFCVMHS